VVQEGAEDIQVGQELVLIKLLQALEQQLTEMLEAQELNGVLVEEEQAELVQELLTQLMAELEFKILF
jgi:hypothetical protein